jgi:hypothetical protein
MAGLVRQGLQAARSRVALMMMMLAEGKARGTGRCRWN